LTLRALSGSQPDQVRQSTTRLRACGIQTPAARAVDPSTKHSPEGSAPEADCSASEQAGNQQRNAARLGHSNLYIADRGDVIAARSEVQCRPKQAGRDLSRVTANDQRTQLQHTPHGSQFVKAWSIGIPI